MTPAFRVRPLERRTLAWLTGEGPRRPDRRPGPIRPDPTGSGRLSEAARSADPAGSEPVGGRSPLRHKTRVSGVRNACDRRSNHRLRGRFEVLEAVEGIEDGRPEDLDAVVLEDQDGRSQRRVGADLATVAEPMRVRDVFGRWYASRAAITSWPPRTRSCHAERLPGSVMVPA
jgi:hypothetical protein